MSRQCCGCAPLGCYYTTYMSRCWFAQARTPFESRSPRQDACSVFALDVRVYARLETIATRRIGSGNQDPLAASGTDPTS